MARALGIAPREIVEERSRNRRRRFAAISCVVYFVARASSEPAEDETGRSEREHQPARARDDGDGTAGDLSGGPLLADASERPARRDVPRPISDLTRQHECGPPRVAARSRNALVFLDSRNVWAFEAAERLTFVHSCRGKFDVDLSLAAIEAVFRGASVRVHRNWLVNLESVKAMEGETVLHVGTSTTSEGLRIPRVRDRAKQIRALLREDTTGLRMT